MRCPKCKIGKLKYYPDNNLVHCAKCDYRNGYVKFIRKFLREKE